VISELAKRVLAAGVDDWVPLLAIDGIARQLASVGLPGDARLQVIYAVKSLVDAGLVKIGAVSDAGFVSWEGTPDNWMSELQAIYQGVDDNVWGFAVWFSNTSLGDELGRRELRKSK